jgi:MFS family permease
VGRIVLIVTPYAAMVPHPLAVLRTLPAPVRLLVAGSFVNKLGTFIIPYLTLVLRKDFHLPDEAAARLLLAYGGGSLVSIVVGGVLTDRLGRRLTLLLSLLGSGVIAVALGCVSSIRVFAPLLVLLGFVADLYRPAASSIIGDLLPSAQRATGFAALRTAVNLGFAVGMSVGGFIEDWSWRLLFIGDGATTLLYGAVVYLFIRETRPAGPTRSEPTDGLPTSPWRDTVFLQTLLVSLSFSLMFFSHLTELPLTITLTAGYPAKLYGVLVAVNGLLIALFEMSVVERLRPFRRLRVAALGTFLTGLAFSSAGLSRHWSWFLLVVVGYTAGEILTTPQKMAFVTDWAPPASRGRYLSFYQATWSIAMGLNPILFLPLRTRLGDAAFWPLMMLLAAPSALLLLHLDRVADRPEKLRGATDTAPPLEAALAAEP